MAILWCGGEDIDFPTRGGNFTSTTNTAYFRSGYARQAISSANTSAARSSVFPGGAVTSAWLHYYLGAAYFYANVPWAGLGKSTVIAGTVLNPGVFVGTGSSTTKLALFKVNSDGTTLVKLAEESGTSLSAGVRVHLCIQNMGATASVTCYVNGAVVLGPTTYDLTSTGCDAFEQVILPAENAGGSYGWMSEFIVADEDTRAFDGLVTLAPSGSGDADTFTSGAYGDVDEATLNDADKLVSGAAGQVFNAMHSGLPAGTFGIKAVKIAARAQKVGSGPGTLALGTKVGNLPLAGCSMGTYQGTFQQLSDRQYAMRADPTESGLISAVRIWHSSTAYPTAKIRVFVYSNSGAAPDALLGVSAEVVGIPGTRVDYPLLTPVLFTAGQTYWVGFLCDTAIYVCYAAAGTAERGGALSRSYALGPADPFGSNVEQPYPAMMIPVKASGQAAAVAGQAVSSPLATYERLMPTNPITGVPFTQDEVNNLLLELDTSA